MTSITSRVPSELCSIRRELSKLQPPRWTKQQQPKRINKSEDTIARNLDVTSKNVNSMVRYNEKQIKVLNRNFVINNNPTSSEFYRTAKDTGLDHYQVKKWFQNRRAKERKRAQKKQWHSRI